MYSCFLVSSETEGEEKAYFPLFIQRVLNVAITHLAQSLFTVDFSKYVDVSPYKSIEFAPLDDGSESEGSFDSANLTDDDNIEDESDDNDSVESDPDDYLY